MTWMYTSVHTSQLSRPSVETHNAYSILRNIPRGIIKVKHTAWMFYVPLSSAAPCARLRFSHSRRLILSFFLFLQIHFALFYYSLVGRDFLSVMLPHCCISIIFCSWFTGYVLCFQLQSFLSTFLSLHGKPQNIIFIKVINQLKNFLSNFYLSI